MKKKIVNNKKPVKSIKKPAKKPPSLHSRITELEDQLLALVTRLDMTEAAIQVIKDAQEKNQPMKNIPDTWQPAPTPRYPAWPNWCMTEVYGTTHNKNKATA